jgi:chromosome segregation ATPase
MTWSNNIKMDAIGLAAEVADLRRELEQQATLLGKGSEREARYLAACSEYRIKLDKLEAENAALRKDKERLEVERCECLRTMDLALNSNAGLREENAALKTALDHQMSYQRELRADRDRLDWLDKTGCWLTITGQKNFVSGSARAVIDAAMGEGK